MPHLAAEVGYSLQVIHLTLGFVSTLSLMFLTRCDTNQAAQPNTMTRDLRVRKDIAKR